MKTETVIISVIVGVLTSAVSWGLLFFILKNIYARFDTKADKCICEDRHRRLDADAAKMDKTIDDIYNLIRTISNDVARIAERLNINN